MLKYARHLAVSLLIGLCVPLAPGKAQQSGEADVAARLDCGGQYECIELRPLTAAEARTSRGYPGARALEEATRPSAEPAADAAATRTLVRRQVGGMREIN